MAIIALSLQIFCQEFYRNVPWVVLCQTYYFCPNLWIWLVVMETERLFKKQNHPLRSHKGNKAEALQKCLLDWCFFFVFFFFCFFLLFVCCCFFVCFFFFCFWFFFLLFVFFFFFFFCCFFFFWFLFFCCCCCLFCLFFCCWPSAFIVIATLKILQWLIMGKRENGSIIFKKKSRYFDKSFIEMLSFFLSFFFFFFFFNCCHGNWKAKMPTSFIAVYSGGWVWPMGLWIYLLLLSLSLLLSLLLLFKYKGHQIKSGNRLINTLQCLLWNVIIWVHLSRRLAVTHENTRDWWKLKYGKVC